MAVVDSGTSMFLPEVENNPQPSAYLDAMEAARRSGQEYWQIWNLLAFRPQLAHHLARMSHEIMFAPAPISPALRELIAAYTSSLNRCTFCMKAHAAVAAHLYGDEALVWSAIDDLEGSSVGPEEKAMLRFARKVTLDSGAITAADMAPLKEAGWDDTAIFYAIAACALFNFYNRYVSANGVALVSDEAFRRLGVRMAERGYNRD